MFSDIECPYCEKGLEINHDDGYGYEEDEVFEQKCEHCGKTFTYTTSISFYHEAQKAPCLNGKPHNWIDISGFPEGFQSNRHKCSYCEKIELKDKTLKYDGKTDTWNK